MTDRIYMALGPEGWGRGPTQEDALSACVAHIPENIASLGAICKVQILRAPADAELDIHGLVIEWPPENDPEGLRTEVIGYVHVRILADADGLLSYQQVEDPG
jgi:hypothetical protein